MSKSSAHIGNMKLFGNVESITVTNVIDDNGTLKKEDQTYDIKLTPEYREGYKIGHEECNLKAQAEIAHLKDQINILSQQIPETFSKALIEIENNVESELCNVAFQIAEIIITRELKDPQSIIQNIIKETLSPVCSYNDIKLKLSTTDATLIKKIKFDNYSPNIEILGENSLIPGDVIVESPQGIIDGKISSRIEVLREFLINKLSSESKPEDDQSSKNK